MFWKSQQGLGNEALTENLDKSHASTLDPVLDLFSKGGAMRNSPDDDIISLFVKAFGTDKFLALKCLLYLRDIRGGAGERRVFRTILKWLGDHHPEAALIIVCHIPQYGRWDDLWCLLDTKSRPIVIELVQNQLLEDQAVKPSLLAKWMPSEGASSKKTRALALDLADALNLTPKQYRKITAGLRRQIGIVEHKMSARQWTSIEYSHVPSRASLLYRKAFKRHDEEGYTSFIDDVLAGKKRIHAGVLYPDQIVKRVREERDTSLDALWKSLPDYAGNQKAIVLADTSGSMYGDRAIDISIALAIYFAERNTSPAFGGKFITFSEKPQIQPVIGASITDKVQNLEKAHWGYNTDLRLAFKEILNLAKAQDVPADEMPEVLYVISDMQFDEACTGNTTYDDVKATYAAAGYKLPTIVFWNVRASFGQPATIKDMDTILVSGTSPVVFKYVLESKSHSPVDFMLEVLSHYDL